MIDILPQCIKKQRPASPKMAVLVRVKNEMIMLPEFWRRIARQTIYPDLEIIFLDSGSTDGTLEFLANLPVTLYKIASRDFRFGSSCNLIASLSVAPMLVFLSGHVLIEQKDTLEKILNILVKNPYSAGYLRQIPNKLIGATAYERAYLAKRFPPRSVAIVTQKVPAGFSNAASAFTRASWDRNRFPDVDASEDYIWAKKHLALGGKLLYLPGARVMHSHRESAEAVYSRVRLNVRSRGISGSKLQATFYFLGVLLSLLLQGASWGEARRFAAAHARAYLPERRTVSQS